MGSLELSLQEGDSPEETDGRVHFFGRGKDPLIREKIMK